MTILPVVAIAMPLDARPDVDQSLSVSGDARSAAAPKLFRHVVESIVFLTCAVVLFRAFAAEGYMISTGSMAPSLLGYHRLIECPACEYSFPHGASASSSAVQIASAQSGFLASADHACCPNCGQSVDDVSNYPRNEGDQLLVHKHAYAIRHPRRWETVVFRNPSNPVEAYVKRIGGLPGESILIHRGDVYADGILQRKSLMTQRSMRVTVYDDNFRPTDGSWRPRWVIDDGVIEQDGRYDFDASSSVDAPSADDDFRWVTYQHYLRSGGNHQSTVRIPKWPADANMVAPQWPQLSYDEATGRLTARGVLDSAWHERLRICSSEQAFVDAIDLLESRSRHSPIVDQYGYNADRPEGISYAVRDLMWSGQVRAASGQLRVQLLYGRQPFYADFDFASGRVSVVTLDADGAELVLGSAICEANFAADTGAVVEVSTFDRQLLVAVNGVEVMPPVAFAATELSEKRSRSPVRFGVKSSSSAAPVSVANVRLYRDVYVTPKGDLDEIFEVGPDEYFVLGDNSPVSVDSRVWDEPAVAHRALIGKPFVVHLPSKQRQITWRGESRHVRLPDWDRVRYVH